MSVLVRAQSHILGLTAALTTLTTSISTEATDRAAADTVLNTAITTAATNAQNANDALELLVLKKASNLSDVANVATARTNLAVYSTSEVDSAILAAQVALGTNFTVNNNVARDALVNLDMADTVMVMNGGAWVKYGVESVTGGVATFFVMSSKAEFENAQSAAAVKAAYESNADTNAFTNAAKAKVDLVSVTSAIDLDKVVETGEFVTDLAAGAATDVQLASAKAIQTYVTAAVTSGGAGFKTESVIVASDKIVLAFAPKDGMILNFATVRHIDVSGVAYDIPVAKDVSDATGKTYTLAPDTTGQFDTKSVTVQYPYITA